MGAYTGADESVETRTVVSSLPAGRPARVTHVELSSNGGYIRRQTVDGYKTLPNNLICFIIRIESFNVGRRLSVHCSER